jgi:SEC-C motif domain protein
MTSPELCPCHSGKFYIECCQRYHQGAFAENALILMRSRYSAYALQLADYLIQTTHPENPAYSRNIAEWKNHILEFARSTQFVGLEIIDFQDGNTTAAVTFRAILKQNDRDVSFTEKSRFIKMNHRWFYRDGVQF